MDCVCRFYYNLSVFLKNNSQTMSFANTKNHNYASSGAYHLCKLVVLLFTIEVVVYHNVNERMNE